MRCLTVGGVAVRTPGIACWREELACRAGAGSVRLALTRAAPQTQPQAREPYDRAVRAAEV
jgi:hypothetical protein